MGYSSMLVIILSIYATTALAQISGKTAYSNSVTSDYDLGDIIEEPEWNYTSVGDRSGCLYADFCSNFVHAYQVTFAQQGSWNVCLCDNSVMNISYMAEQIGKVPLPLRSMVTTFNAASYGVGYGAFTNSPGWTVGFLTPEQPAEIFIRQAAAAYDTHRQGSAMSSSSSFLSAMSSDSCVPDVYGLSDASSSFASLAVAWVNYVYTGQSIPACMSNSLQYMSSILPASSIRGSTTPPTSSPVTPAPTSSPVTPAPTSSPVTPAPTSAPVTPAPTSAPVTPAPVTSAPVTPAPTSAPVTPAPPTSCTIAVRQTLSNTWQSSGVAYSQYTVVYTNTGTQSTPVNARLTGGTITQYWTISQASDGSYNLPSYMADGLAAGSSLEWGYVIQSSSAATITLITPASCSSSSTSSPTSAPVTSAPTPSAPVTSAPVTPAPTPSAPVTPAPTSAPTPSAGCKATISQTTTNSWSGGGQANLLITNTGSKPITALTFTFAAGASKVSSTWNTVGSYSPAAYTLPLSAGGQINSIGFTYNGNSAPVAQLVSVSC
eukprot:TRINITY_DN58_c0_g1_i4.p1 TRINITY_DN58_c0_g1~~TRINITY_DN58_c0_g1_i4.p1  ORF type:complete len:574 (-),score=179.64 TRINITY_DN58_c0_g1_i4:72-1706(-)